MSAIRNRRVSANAEGRTDPAYLMYRLGQLAASNLPERLLFEGAHLAGGLAAKYGYGKREVVRRNLARVVERDLDQVTDEAFRSYARYWVETLRIPKPGV